MTYLLLNLAFLVVPLALLVLASISDRRRGQRGSFLGAVGLALAAVLVLTAVFDNVLIALGVFSFEETRITGLRLGLVPVEDFLYAAAAVIGLPSLWVLLRRNRA